MNDENPLRRAEKLVAERHQMDQERRSESNSFISALYASLTKNQGEHSRLGMKVWLVRFDRKPLEEFAIVLRVKTKNYPYGRYNLITHNYENLGFAAEGYYSEKSSGERELGRSYIGKTVEEAAVSVYTSVVNGETPEWTDFSSTAEGEMHFRWHEVEKQIKERNINLEFNPLNLDFLFLAFGVALLIYWIL